MLLQRGAPAADAVRRLAADKALLALEIDPEAREGRGLQLVAVASPTDAVLIDATSAVEALRAVPEPFAAHDAKVVHRVLLSAGLPAPERWACVRLAETLLAGGRHVQTSLEAVSQRLGFPEPPAGAAGFEAMAARAKAAARVVAAQVPELRASELGWVSKIEAGAVAAIAEMEHTGMAFDAVSWRKLAQDATAERSSLKLELDRIFAPAVGRDLLGGAALSYESDQDLKAALAKLGHTVVNVRRDTIAELPAPLGPLLTRYRELAKLVSAYGDAFLEHVAADGRVHPTFEQIGASTGRMACHSPNLQSVVKDSPYRACFRCAPDRRLVVADYATCELRILAEVSGDPVFAEAFARGDDLHARVAQTMFGKPVSKTENPELRHRAKAVNFGLVYGMGAAGLAKAIDSDADTARGLLERYFATFPRIKSYLERGAREALERGFARTMTGRRLYLDPGPDKGDRAAAERIAKNMPIQGTSADITKLALTRVRLALRPFARAALVNAVHDEIVVECNAADAEVVRDVVRREMTAAGAEVLKRTPVAVDADITETWSK
jgi:DNA polymerase I